MTFFFIQRFMSTPDFFSLMDFCNIYNKYKEQTKTKTLDNSVFPSTYLCNTFLSKRFRGRVARIAHACCDDTVLAPAVNATARNSTA